MVSKGGLQVQRMHIVGFASLRLEDSQGLLETVVYVCELIVFNLI